MSTYSATYSPEDDKLRLSCAHRLDAETYARVKGAGFAWAPKQDLFFAVWTPSREDLCLELAGEIGDEDTSLVERAEERAERFENYSARRGREAEGEDEELVPEPGSPGFVAPGEAFRALEATLKAGVRVVVAPQLFPTPPELAERMVELAGIEAEHRVLEPSAGTGNLLRAAYTVGQAVEVVAVEVDPRLIEAARVGMLARTDFRCADFLEVSGLGTFDRIVMNPPFGDGADVKHILRAASMLRPGGVLVGLCANGSRQAQHLRPLADFWEELPEGTFAAQGTGVRVALLVISRPLAVTSSNEGEVRESNSRSEPSPYELPQAWLFAPLQPGLFETILPVGPS